MRTISTDEGKVLDGYGICQHVRVKVKDGSGNFQDLSTYGGYNWIQSVEWGESIDEPCATASVKLIREVDALSMNPLMTASAINVGYVVGGSYSALIAVGRQLTIEVATIPQNQTPSSGDWGLYFHGYIDSLDVGGNEITLQCRDLGAAVMDAFLEYERVYGWFSSGGVHHGVRIWAPDSTWTLSDYLAPTDGKRNARPFVYKTTTAGTGAATGSEPGWPTSSTVNDGTAVHTFQGDIDNAGYDLEDVIQAILNDAGVSVTLNTPSSPGWALKQYKQTREGALEAIRKLAIQIGWDVRYKYDSGSGTFKLTLWEPDRTSPSASRTFDAADFMEISTAKIDLSTIRNVVRVIYSDSSSKDPAGNPRRRTITRTATDLSNTSISTYGRRFMEISESSSSNIDTSTEAQAMADACLRDLMDPTLELSVELAYGFPWAEVGDYYTFSANERYFSSAQSLALHSVKHKTAGPGVLVTTFDLRGAPSLGSFRWEQLSTRNPTGVTQEIHQLSAGLGTSGIEIQTAPVPGGIAVTVLPGTGATNSSWDLRQLPEEYEVHLSQTANFTPTGNTLYSVGQTRDVVINDLTPGVGYYAAVLPKFRNAGKLVIGEKSTEVSETAGRIGAGHLKQEIDTTRLPVNGGFDTYDVGTGLPEHWYVDPDGDSDPTIAVRNDTDGVSGSYYLRFTGHASGDATGLLSALAPARGGALYKVSARVKGISGTTTTFALILNELDYDQAAVTGTTIHSWTADDYASWTTISGFVVLDADTRFVQVRLTSTSGTTDVCDFDEVEIHEAKLVDTLYFSADTLTTGAATRYASPFGAYVGGSGGGHTTEFHFRTPGEGYVAVMTADLQGGASTDVQYVLTARKEVTDTSLTCTVAAAGTYANDWDLAHGFKVTTNERVSLKIVSSDTGGGPVAGQDLVVTMGYYV